MTQYRTAPLAADAIVMMRDGKMMMMKDGEATAPMDYEITMTDGSTVMPDGTMKIKDGKEVRMKEGQMMRLNGKMMAGGMSMDGDKTLKGHTQ